MNAALVPQFARTLANLDRIVQKAEAHAEARKFDSARFCSHRLAPDMLDLSKQIQIATDTSKFVAAALAGVDAPRFEDTEKGLPELRARLRKTIEFLESLDAQKLDSASADQLVPVASPKGMALKSHQLLIMRNMPNFFFHVVTAYDILRASGVPLGKADYLGELPFQPAAP